MIDDPADRSGAEAVAPAVADRLAEIAGHLNVLNSELVELTAGLLESGDWQQAGKRTPSAFLQWKLGLSKSRADDIVDAAGRRDPFSVGRAQHVVPDRTRRIVERRDRGCRVPGCDGRFVEIHHIVHWNDGGPTDTWNLVSICPAHHKLHHQGLLGITGDADQFDSLVFTDEHGDPIPGAGAPTLPTGPPRTPVVPYTAPLAGRFDWNWIGLGWVHPNARRKRIEMARRLAERDRAAA